MKLCRQCKKYWIRFDDNFGYCKAYNCQAKHDDSCETIKVMVK